MQGQVHIKGEHGQISRRTRSRTAADGFTLIEVMVAMVVLSVGLLSLVGVFTMALKTVGASSNHLIAREKAREAVESVHAARDTGRLSWNNIQNVADGGIFVAGAQSLREPGVDGIISTADDAAAELEKLRRPGPDGILGNTDDEVMPLIDFTRQVTITPLLNPNGSLNRNLRQITVTISYRVDDRTRTYTLTTYVSSFS